MWCVKCSDRNLPTLPYRTEDPPLSLCACFIWFQLTLKSGTNILYWRTTGILVGGKMVKPVLLKNIQIEGKLNKTITNLRLKILCMCNVLLPLGVAYTSECFPCRPGWFSPAPGSSSCEPCPSNTFSIKGASSCTLCPEHHFSRMHMCDSCNLLT